MSPHLEIHASFFSGKISPAGLRRDPFFQVQFRWRSNPSLANRVGEDYQSGGRGIRAVIYMTPVHGTWARRVKGAKFLWLDPALIDELGAIRDIVKKALTNAGKGQ